MIYPTQSIRINNAVPQVSFIIDDSTQKHVYCVPHRSVAAIIMRITIAAIIMRITIPADDRDKAHRMLRHVRRCGGYNRRVDTIYIYTGEMDSQIEMDSERDFASPGWFSG